MTSPAEMNRVPQKYELEGSDSLRAVVDADGAFVESITAPDGHPLIFSRQSVQVGSNIKDRGGIPVCSPIFDRGEQFGLEQHGFARRLRWDVDRYDSAGGIVLALRNPREQNQDIPEEFAGYNGQLSIATIVDELGTGIRMQLTVRNVGNLPFVESSGLHPYFPVTEGNDAGGYDITYGKTMGQRLDPAELDPSSLLPGDNSTLAVNGPGGNWLLQTTGLPRIVKWSDKPELYFCCEPTANGALDELPEAERAKYELQPGQSRTYGMEIRWLPNPETVS